MGKHHQQADPTRLLELTSKWEKSRGPQSRIRSLGSTVPKIAALCADLADDETLVVIDAMGEDWEEEKLTFRQKLFNPLAKLVLDTRPKYSYNDLLNADYYAILAPAWNALYGTGGPIQYAMNQAKYKFREDEDGTSTEPLRKGAQVESKRIDLITSMISYSVGGRINEADLQWFGENWRSYASVWNLLQDDRVILRSRAEVLIENSGNGTSPAVLGGAL